MDDAASKKDPTLTPGEVLKFHYIKGNHYRAIHVDGAYGGLTARGFVAMSCYNERRPVPQQTELAVIQVSDGSTELGPETDERRTGKDGIIRELDATMYMSPEVARDVAHWLLSRVNEWEELNKTINKKQSGETPSQ